MKNIQLIAAVSLFLSPAMLLAATPTCQLEPGKLCVAVIQPGETAGFNSNTENSERHIIGTGTCTTSGAVEFVPWNYTALINPLENMRWDNSAWKGQNTKLGYPNSDFNHFQLKFKNTGKKAVAVSCIATNYTRSGAF